MPKDQWMVLLMDMFIFVNVAKFLVDETKLALSRSRLQ